MSLTAPSSDIQIREVWEENLEKEFALIREIVDLYPYVAMDTEFPGIVLKPLGEYRTTSESFYASLRENVDMTKLIQLGLTFADEGGNLPTCDGATAGCIWQFNFREFDLSRDIYHIDSIDLLRQSGIDFASNFTRGVDVQRFGELLMSSGVVLNHDIVWVTFHSAYDFGYLIKLLTGKNLPDSQVAFLELLNVYFPVLYDIKHMMRYCNNLHGGLSKVGELLNVPRVGIGHQAGSDSLLTLCVFSKMQAYYFNGSTDKYTGVLYGIGVET